MSRVRTDDIIVEVRRTARMIRDKKKLRSLKFSTRELNFPEQEVFVATLGGSPVALVDTACTRCCIGSETFDNIQREISTVCQEFPEVAGNRPFKGVGGHGTSTRAVFIPIGLSGRAFWVRVSVLPGSTPFLLSRFVIKELGLNAMLDESLLSSRDGQWQIPMMDTDRGHLAVSLISYPKGFIISNENLQKIRVMRQQSDAQGQLQAFACTFLGHAELIEKGEQKASSTASMATSGAEALRRFGS